MSSEQTPHTTYRRSDYDVTDSVQVSSAEAVSDAVRQLFASQWPNQAFTPIATAFHTFGDLVGGSLPGYTGIDTVYHDRQHTLDASLAMARLLVGYERGASPDDQLGFERAAMGLISAIFHDAGYVRKVTDTQRNGAEYTNCHVSRSAQFLGEFMPTIGMAQWAPIAMKVVHFSGYEIAFDAIGLDNPKDIKVGHLLGTADLIAQMSDRCYLEKCRDRLYPEFVLGGLAANRDATGTMRILYGSGLDLLKKTPAFIDSAIKNRLNGCFGGVYHHLENLFNGENPYLQAMQQHRAYLEDILHGEQWSMLRRQPPLFTKDPSSMQNVQQLMVSHLKTV
jgi:hypothetical protein